MIRRILIVFFILSLIPLAGSVLSQYISPAIAWQPAFLGLLFPLLILVQVLFLILFLLMKRKVVVLPLLAILACWPQINHTFQLVPNRSAGMAGTGGIRVMTYNVRLFDLYKWSGSDDAGTGIINLIRENDPDVLCLQEMLIQEAGPFSLDGLKQQLKQMPYSYVDFYDVSARRKHGLAIFSKFPIMGYGNEHFSGTRNMMIHADISIGGQKVRVFNNHLESTHFERDEFEMIDMRGAGQTRITREKVNVIIDRMKQAYRRRGSQADLLHRSITDSPYPVIVCGDFNDTPVSYSVSRVRRGLQDAFRSGGRGMGVTFPGMIIPLRIDYILHDKAFRSGEFKTGKAGFSDHRPVCATVYLGSGS